ncbi:hypothetical protein BU16DRAFT_586660 [Lophium mytilinum]|uniref:Uncharacterized protein n=1 Tax=Lophium mytilinum TaxID=390894 RepID=A0A6A6Q9U7_9PEZI|nr:hypothetical protein BU16DRAFT_586660 [Lophium mytilinum]
MAPFRARDRTNRSGRGQVEHNVLEGLPINQYREVEVTVGQNLEEKASIDKDAWPELPMPRDSHLLPEHSQQLLRAARAGRLYKPPLPVDEEKENPDEEDENKQTQRTFTVRKYVKVARTAEEPEPEYLAKRRKGLPSQYSVYSGAVGPLAQTGSFRKTKVKKVDNDGNVSVYEVLVPEGQTVEGEVQDNETLPDAPPVAAVPGTVVEGVGVVNPEGVVVSNDLIQQTPPRRRPPISKKKSKKGPGRGKKKVAFETEGANTGNVAADGSNTLSAPGNNTEGGSIGPSDGDTPMADAQDGEDEEGEDGEDEDGSDDDDREEGELPQTPVQSSSPSKKAELSTDPVRESTPPSAPDTIKSPAKEEPKTRSSRDPSSSPDLPLAIAHSRQNSMNQIPTLDSPSAPVAPASGDVHFSDGEPDLFGSLERHLDKDGKSDAT